MNLWKMSYASIFKVYMCLIFRKATNDKSRKSGIRFNLKVSGNHFTHKPSSVVFYHQHPTTLLLVAVEITLGKDESLNTSLLLCLSIYSLESIYYKLIAF